MKHPIRILVAATALLFIVACGQKGPLIVEKPTTSAQPSDKKAEK